MERNLDEKVVVIDRAQYDKLVLLAFRNNDPSFKGIRAHIHKFNPHLREDYAEQRTQRQESYRNMRDRVLHVLKNFQGKTLYLRLHSELYEPVKVLGRATDKLHVRVQRPPRLKERSATNFMAGMTYMSSPENEDAHIQFLHEELPENFQLLVGGKNKGCYVPNVITVGGR